jgi:hypothetical protein
VQSSILTDDDRLPVKPTEHNGPPSLSILQGVVSVTAAGCLVLMVADMAADQSFVPVQMRILALAAVLGSLAIYLTTWSDARSERRHEELMRRLDSRLRESCCAEAYVDGLARRPLGGRGHLYSA